MDYYQKMLPIRTIEQAKAIRNQSWQNCTLIPTWCTAEKKWDWIAFITHPDIAHECSESLYATMQQDAVRSEKLSFY